MNFNPEHPIVIGFAGNAGAGKTSTANAIVPPATMNFTGQRPDILWDHIFFAMPIYDMVIVKTMIEGYNLKDRMLFGLHDIAYDLLQRRCGYDDCIELVYDLFSLPCVAPEGDKPRTFMQTAGDLCRALYEDCFSDKAIRTINQRFSQASSEYGRFEEDPPISFNIISDMRMHSELDAIRRQPNSIVIKFIADQAELDRRIVARSGVPLTEEQKNHKSEAELLSIPDESYDIIVDTTTLTLKDQAAMVKQAVLDTVRQSV